MALKGGGFGTGLRLPLQWSNVDPAHDMIKTIKEEVLQNLRILFLTIPGERVRYKNFGVGMKSFLFENDTLTLHEQIKNRIAEQVRFYMPAIKTIEITVMSPLTNSEIEEGTIKIMYKFHISTLNIIHSVMLSLNHRDGVKTESGEQKV